MQIRDATNFENGLSQEQFNNISKWYELQILHMNLVLFITLNFTLILILSKLEKKTTKRKARFSLETGLF